MDNFSLQNTRPLVDCAMGRVFADLVIRNGQWVCVQTGEIIPHTDLAIKGQRIAFVGDSAAHTIGPDTKVVDAEGMYLVPGLLDAHLHVESAMLTVSQFAHAVMVHGTTGAFIDPHEITNVLGMEGVRLMVDEAARQPIHIFVQMPSCVPSASGLETAGAEIHPQDVAEAMQMPGVIGLGEVMNFPGVFMNDEKMQAEIDAARVTGKTIGGHYASPDLGESFHGYVAAGIEDDHEGTRKEDAVARARQGMKVLMRFGSGWRDVAELSRTVTEDGLASRRFVLCTDDCHAHTLTTEGHMDRVIRHAIQQGLTPMQAIQMATINAAEHFRVDREIGMIAPTRYADILLVPDLEDFRAARVFARGVEIARDGKALLHAVAYPYPQTAIETVKLEKTFNAEDFSIQAPIQQGQVTANVIGIIQHSALTEHLKFQVKVKDGAVRIDLARDILKAAVVERHTGSGRVSMGLVKGFGFAPGCAAASTVAHDSHQLLVVGSDEGAMAQAVNEIKEMGGGQVVVKDEKVIGKVTLPIAGLMSNSPAEEVARQAGTVLDGFKACGCSIDNPNMQFSLMALVVIPSLRLSDLGLVDVNQFGFIPLLEK